MLVPSFLTALLLASSSSARQSFSNTNYAVKERHHVPHGWRRVGPAPLDSNIALRIALKQSDFEALDRQLHAVSDPRNPRYGQHLSAADVQRYVRPSESTHRHVNEWLATHGFADSVDYTPAGDWAKLSLSVHDAEVLLNTKYYLFRHEDGSQVIRAPEWSLPVDLHDHIDAIQPTTSFFRFQPKAVRWMKAPSEPYNATSIESAKAVVAQDLPEQDIWQACNASTITPTCLRTLYGTKDYTPKLPQKSKVGYCNYLEETTISTDMQKFLETYREDAKGKNANVDIRIVNNGQNQQVLDDVKQKAQASVEGNLDGQTMMGMVYPMPVMAFNTGGRPMVSTPYNPNTGTPVSNEPYLEWLEFMQGLPDSEVPPTISTSYGEDEQSVPPEYARRVCQSFAQLGSRGVTLLFSSGDAGVGNRSPTSPNCEIYPDPQVAANAVPNFMPEFPASCPYVTAVGATKGLGVGSFSMEVAAGYPDGVSKYASGGGFSNYFTRPAWQEQVVQEYVQNLTPEEVKPDMYNRSGRAYPDLAANGQQYAVVWNQKLIRVDGTSASAPTMAAVVALLNDDLMASGRPPLGFMNPWLYSQGKAGFTDIISGSAKGCGVAGFPAKQGWDAVTGFGTPNFVQLQKLTIQHPETAPGPSQSGYIDRGSSLRGRLSWRWGPKFF